jgi:IMP dehydrogenase
MGSLEAIAAGKGSRYQQMPGQVRVPHGVPGWVPYKGDVATVIGPCLAGTRDGMAAVGAKTIRDLQERANFHQHTNAGIRESSPHDVVVITETPILKGGAA